MSAAIDPDARRGERRFEWLVFALAFGMRLVAVWQYQHGHPNAEHPVIDEASYDRWARAIAGGEWLGREVFFQEPLYPYFLGSLYALFGPERIVARIVQCLLWAWCAVLVGRIARLCFGKSAARWSGLGLACYGPGLLFPCLLLKENLFLPLFALFALRLLQAQTWKNWLVIGALGALGALLRGNMLVLLPVFVLWAWIHGERRNAWTRALAFAGGAALVLLPVGLRNLEVGGAFVLTTSGAGTNLYGGNNPENLYGRASEFSFVRGIPEHEADDWRHEAERRAGHTLEAREVSRFWMGEVLHSVRDDPWLHARILANKLRLTLGSYEVPDNHFLEWDAHYVPIARLPWPGFGVWGTLGLAGMLLVLVSRERRTGPAGALALLFVLYLGTIVLTVTSDRARLPLVPLLLPCAAWLLVEAWTRLRSGSARAKLATCAALAAGALVVLIPCLPASERANDFDEREYNLAVQRLKEPGGLAEARSIAAGLAARRTQSARVLLLAAEVELRAAREGGTHRALAEVEAEVAPLAREQRLRARERFHAQWIAGTLALERGDFAAAQELFASALVFDPEDPHLRLSLASAVCAQSEKAPVERARLEEALRSLLALEREPLEGTLPMEARVARCGAQFLLGRELLRADERDPRGRELVQSAIEGLREPCLDKTLERGVRARARQLAGTIQLQLRKFDSAETHFRAALSLAGTAEARLSLAETLISELEQGGKAERGEIEQLLQGLDAPGLRERLARLP